MPIAFTSSALNANQRAAPVVHKIVWPRPALKVNLLLLRLTAFLKSPKSSALASSAWHHSHSLVSIPIWDFYFDISEWHILSARAWTHALMLYLTNPRTKRKILFLTKPKGKMYKTKSFRHYIIASLKIIYIYIYIYAVTRISIGFVLFSVITLVYVRHFAWYLVSNIS